MAASTASTAEPPSSSTSAAAWMACVKAGAIGGVALGRHGGALDDAGAAVHDDGPMVSGGCLRLLRHSHICRVYHHARPDH